MKFFSISLVFIAALIGSSALAEAAAPSKLDLNGWELLAPLPDPIGYGGLFAGVLNGRLVAGGGSQFRDKPFWLKGEKTFSDRIFTLASLQGRWVEHPAKLPLKVANFANTSTPEAIYLAGGIDATGCLRQVLKIQAQGDGFGFTHLADLPQPMGYGAAAVVDGRLYVVGGVPAPLSKTPSRETWSLDLSVSAERAAWRREADLPGPGILGAVLGVHGKTLYLFSGIGFDAAGTPTPSKAVYCLNTVDGKWERLVDMPGARVGAVTPCPLVPDHRFFLIGGYAEVFYRCAAREPGIQRPDFAV